MAKSDASDSLTVSFVIVTRNAAAYLYDLIADLIAQDFPSQRLEILVVDGHSTDNTRRVANRLLADSNLTYRIFDNPKRILATGWNIALAQARHDIILRVDAHSRLARDFVSSNVRSHRLGELITGGPIISVSATGSEGILLAVERSRFGAGTARFRNECSDPIYADTIGFGAYRREVFATVGGYHEHLVRHQDNEIHHRMHRAGYRFYLDPEIKSTRIIRSNLGSFVRQKFLTGYWIPLAASVKPACFAPRHFVPFLFAIAVLGGAGIAAYFGVWWPLISSLGPYFVLAVIFSVKACIDRQFRKLHWLPLLPPLFLLTHLTYGLGTLCGLLRAPSFRKTLRNYRPPSPISSQAAGPIGGVEGVESA